MLATLLSEMLATRQTLAARQLTDRAHRAGFGSSCCRIAGGSGYSSMKACRRGTETRGMQRRGLVFGETTASPHAPNRKVFPRPRRYGAPALAGRAQGNAESHRDSYQCHLPADSDRSPRIR